MANEEKLKFEISAIDSATRVFNQVGAAAKNLQSIYVGLQGAIAGATAVLAIDKIVDATIEWERANNRMTATLRATGGAVGITRRELDEMAASMSKTTEFSERQVTNAEAALISFGGMHQDIFKGALKDTADLAAKMGIDLVSAAHLVGRAYQDPVLGLRGFQKELGTLTFTEKEYIAQLEANGRVEEAQLAIHDLIQRKIGGTAELMNTGLTKAVKDNQKAWEELEASIGNFGKGAIVGSANALTNWVNGVKAMAAAARSGSLSLNPSVNRANMEHPGGRGASGSWGDSVEEATLAAAAAADKEALARNREREAHAKAVPVLKSWTAQLSETTKAETALMLIQEGEAKTWTNADRARLLAIARLLDYRKVMETYVVGLKEYFSAQEKADTALTSFNESTSIANLEAGFQISLIGKTAVEIEKLTATRKIGLEAIAKQGEINAELFPEQFRAISEAAKNATKVTLDMIDKRREAERSWATGTKTAFHEYVDHATNAAEQAAFVFGNAFKNMEDALVSFLSTGTADFRAFANSVITDLIRIQVRAAMAGLGSSILGALGGGSDAPVQLSGPGFTGHTGGVVGQDIMQRSLPISPVGVPRYHMGLAPDERLGIFQTGERIIPRGGSAGPSIIIQQSIGGNVTKADLAAVAQAGRDGATAAIAEERRRNPNGPFGG